MNTAATQTHESKTQDTVLSILHKALLSFVKTNISNDTLAILYMSLSTI